MLQIPAITKRVDDLGDQFRPAMRKGWLAYMKKIYAVDPGHYDVAIGQGDLVVPDDACTALMQSP